MTKLVHCVNTVFNCRGTKIIGVNFTTRCHLKILYIQTGGWGRITENTGVNHVSQCQGSIRSRCKLNYQFFRNLKHLCNNLLVMLKLKLKENSHVVCV